MRISRLFIFTLSVLVFVACQSDDDFVDTSIDDPMDIPDINDVDDPTPEPVNTDIVELGRQLFWDPILSGEKDVACATCHHPNFGYSDGRELPIGVGGVGLGPQRIDAVNDDIGLVPRNSPTIINTAFNGMDELGNYDPDLAPMFWDNRTLSLEAQAIGPLHSFEEMRGHAYDEALTIDSIVARLQSIDAYRNSFEAIFSGSDPINSNTIGEAIAAFERTITATDSPFDRFQAGDQNALTQAQIRGMNRFNQVGCDDCHSGPMFSDYQLHVLGVPDNDLLSFSDDGANGTYAFRTPTLRNLSDTGPYFHNGVAGNLQQSIQFYITARNAANGGPGGPGGPPGGLAANPNVNANEYDPEIRDLGNLNPNDIQDIVAFIRALDDPNYDRSVPSSVPSGLYPGGNID